MYIPGRDFLMRGGRLDNLEMLCGVAAAVSGIATLVLDPGQKNYAGAAGAVFGALVPVVRRLTKVRDSGERDRREKEVADARQRADGLLRLAVEEVLEHMRAHLSRAEGAALLDHRATLFACVEAPDGGRRLVIYSRAGSHKGSTTAWPVDENDPQKCRGFAGQVWAGQATKLQVVTTPWPDEPGDQMGRAGYAEAVGLTVAEVENLNVKSTVFAGTVVLVAGAKWGVLVVDSRTCWFKPNKGEETKARKRVERYATLLGRILTRGL